MKKIISIIALITFMSTLVSCASTTETVSNGDTKILTVWSIATESDSFNHAYQQAIADFEEANPGVKIRYESFENQSYKTKLKTAIAGNDLPDIFYTWGGGFSADFVSANKVLALDEYYADYEENLPKAVLNNATYEEKIYGVPYTTPVSLLFFNKVMFEEIGLNPPTTFDELLAVCKEFKEAGITPIGISAKDTWVLAMTHDALALKAVGAEKLQDTLTKQEGMSYDDPDFITAAEKFRELVELGAYPSGASALSSDEASAQFYGEQIPMFLTGSFLGGAIQRETEEENRAHFSAVPVPVFSNHAKATDFMGGAIDTLMVSATTSEPDLAAKAAFEIARGISKYSYLDGAGTPAWKKDYDDSSVDPLSKKIADYVSEATSFTLWFDTLLSGDDATEYLQLLQELYSDNITAKEFVANMAKKLEGE
ncbi:sugar ABC transporter substrate-binding protein [Clostridia bacterium]|nr:sugar ABC transporter substrate-binding protein [Clostridia bacterium]